MSLCTFHWRPPRYTGSIYCWYIITEHIEFVNEACDFSVCPIQHSASLFTCLGCLRIFFFNTRHTAQGRNTARGVPAFSDRLFGKCKPRKLPLKLPSAAGIISHSANALPRARQASSAASSGVSVQITLSQTRFTPALSQSLSQVRIHSPSPQP